MYQEQHITVEPGFARSSSRRGGRWEAGGAGGPPWAPGGGDVVLAALAALGVPAMVEASLPPSGRKACPAIATACQAPRAPRAMRFEPLTAVVTGQTSTDGIGASRRRGGATAGAGRLVQAPSARASLKTRPPGKPRCMERMALRARYRGWAGAGPMSPGARAPCGVRAAAHHRAGRAGWPGDSGRRPSSRSHRLPAAGLARLGNAPPC